MSPRYFGAVAIIVKSFARIHETNLKNKGVLPPHLRESRRLRQGPGNRPDERARLAELGSRKSAQAVLQHADGSEDCVEELQPL